MLAASAADNVERGPKASPVRGTSDGDRPWRASAIRLSRTIGVLIPFPKMIAIKNAVLALRYCSR